MRVRARPPATQISTGDTGWDVFCLDYRVGAPLNALLSDARMVKYLRIFNMLWRLKRSEYMLSAAWSEQQAHWRALRLLPGTLYGSRGPRRRLC